MEKISCKSVIEGIIMALLPIFPNVTFNAHNQILETAIQLGIGGALIWIAGLLVPSSIAWRRKNFVYVILEAQSGIFNAFFILIS